MAAQYFYDSMGRLSGQSTSLPSTPDAHVSMSAIYDLAGNMTSLTYPDGRVVKQSWDGAAHLQTVTFDNWNGQNVGYKYLTSATYFPNGSPSAMFYGNSVAEGYDMNNRLQTNEIGIVHLGSGTVGNVNFSVKEYCYGPQTSALSSTIPVVQRFSLEQPVRAITAVSGKSWIH